MGMPVVERLVNLTIALLETRRPLTFDELRRRTRYYPQSDASSARRMFERDKETLRSLGVPIETRQDFGMDDPGYLIDRRRYELRDVALTAEEVAALALAVDLAGPSEGALPLAKVAARAPDPDPDHLGLDGPPTRIGLALDAIAEEVATAVVERRIVRFSYRTADGREGVRTVEPFGIVHRRRSWYLVGRDRDRGEPRGFRLDRMLGAIEVVEGAAAFVVPSDVDLAAIVTGPQPRPIEVALVATPVGRWTIEARGGRSVPERSAREVGEDASEDLVRMILPDVDAFRDRAWLLGVAPDAAVTSPSELVDRLQDALRRVVAVHGGDDGDDGVSGGGSDGADRSRRKGAR